MPEPGLGRCGNVPAPSPYGARRRSSADRYAAFGFRTSEEVVLVDAELEEWRSSGQYFDYAGFDIFFRIDGSGPRLLLIHGYPFNSWDWSRIWPTLTELHRGPSTVPSFWPPLMSRSTSRGSVWPKRPRTPTTG